jgi:hypothetical protein
MNSPYVFDCYEIFRSVEIVWIAWGLGILLLPLVVYIAAWQVSQFSRRPVSLSAFHADQHGASYSLSFVLTLPFIVGLIVLILQTSFLLVAKFGTMHAAFMAARAGVVWTTSDERDVPVSNVAGYFDNFPKAQEKATAAAVRAMTPFSSGFFTKQASGQAREDAGKFLDVYRRYIAGSQTELTARRGGRTISMRENYIRNRFIYAAHATKVELTGEGSGEPWQLDLRARVTYEYPVMIAQIPLLGQFFGRRTDDGRHVFDLTSTAVFQNECPRNRTATLGIKASP